MIAGAKPSGGRHDLVDRIEQVTKYPMALLGVAWLVLAVVVLTTDVNGSTSTALVGTLFVLWVIMLVEYLVRLVVTPDTPRLYQAAVGRTGDRVGAPPSGLARRRNREDEPPRP